MSRSNPENPQNFLISIMNLKMSFDYDKLRDFIDLYGKFSNKTSSNINDKIKEWDKKHPEHEYSGFDIYENEIMRISNFEQISKSASIILIYSELEEHLTFICNRVCDLQNNKIKLRDLNGKGIERCKNYLSKVLNIDFSSVNETWKKIKKYNDLRNCLVHNKGVIELGENGKIENNNKANEILQLQNIQIENTGQIIIMNDLPAKEFIDESLIFLDFICEKLRIN